MLEVGLENWEIVPLLTLECTRDKIRAFEREWADLLEADLNSVSPRTTAEEKREAANRRGVKHYANNREKILRKKANYRANNREVIRQKAVERRARNREQWLGFKKTQLQPEASVRVFELSGLKLP